MTGADVNRLVVAIDGSNLASRALTWACELAARTGAEIVAVHALAHRFAGVTPERSQELLEERRALVNGDWIRPALESGVSIRTEIVHGDPRSIVLESAEAEHADLTVFGRTGGDGGPGFLHLGSVVEYAAHHTRRPLAVIPADGWGSVRRIVLGVDGSTESLQAVSWCADLAAAGDLTVLAVAVKEPFLEWTPSSSPDNWRRDVEREIDQWTAPLSAAGAAVEHIAHRDLHPADGLLDVVATRQADLLVVGTRGAGGFTGLRAGGVAMKVLHRASVPLALVPPASSQT